jgi:hypothetical protein
MKQFYVLINIQLVESTRERQESTRERRESIASNEAEKDTLLRRECKENEDSVKLVWNVDETGIWMNFL